MTALLPSAEPRTTSLDTGKQVHISDERGRQRILRNDQAKMVLADLLDQAAAQAWDRSPADSVALEAMAIKLRECRIGKAFRDAACGGYLFRPIACRLPLCADDQRARAARLVDRFLELTDAMEHPVFWTLTEPNVPRGELRPGLVVLKDALAHLRRRAIFAGGPCGGAHRAVAWTDVATGERHRASDEVAPCGHPPHRKELAAVGACRCGRCLEVDVVRDGYRVTQTGCPRCTHRGVAGGVYAIEVTWSKHEDWHPHVHLLADSPWILQAEMREAWRAVTCDAIRRAERRAAGLGGRVPPCEHRIDAGFHPIAGCRGASVVWVEAVTGDPGSDERRAAVRETLKYVTKGLLGYDGKPLAGVGPAELAELMLALRRARLVAGWGTFYHVHDQEDDELDPAEFIVDKDDPIFYGLPRRCPRCRGEARWEHPITARRADCWPGAPGYLMWRAPPGGSV